MRVFRAGSARSSPVTEPATEPMRIWHLLTHTVGPHLRLPPRPPRRRDVPRAPASSGATPPGLDLAGCCDALGRAAAAVPARDASGTTRVSTDVLGRVVEVGVGRAARRVLRRAHLRAAGHDRHRVPRRADRAGAPRRALHPDTRRPGRRPASTPMGDARQVAARRTCRAAAAWCRRPPTTTASRRCSSAAASSTGTRAARHRARVRYMTENHLPGGADLEAFGRPLFAETTFDGVGFGLGFSVVTDTVANKVLSSHGEFAWGGAAQHRVLGRPGRRSITVMFLTQLLPVEHPPDALPAASSSSTRRSWTRPGPQASTATGSRSCSCSRSCSRRGAVWRASSVAAVIAPAAPNTARPGTRSGSRGQGRGARSGRVARRRPWPGRRARAPPPNWREVLISPDARPARAARRRLRRRS